jgi:polyisoprenoid-binding protein YceI
MKKLIVALGVMTLLALNSQQLVAANDAAVEPAPATAVHVPAGAYTLDKTHASLTFRVNHLGFSRYTAQFKQFDAQLQFDPENLAASSVSVTIDPRSLDLDNPPPGFVEQLLGEQWLNVAQFPTMSFVSTKVEALEGNKARITGDFTLHGVTKPVVLEATFNGGYAGHEMDPHARIGFSATGTLQRSDFGIAYGIPEPGSTMGVSDAVDIAIEVEFSGPPLAPSTEATEVK